MEESTNVVVMAATGRKMLEQMNAIQDPVVRYALFFQFIKFLSECGITFLTHSNSEKIDNLNFSLEIDSLCVSEEIDEKSKIEKIKNERKKKYEIEKLLRAQDDFKYISENLSTYLNGFNDWIYRPIYSPDHPCGELLMNKHKKTFEAQSNEINKGG